MEKGQQGNRNDWLGWGAAAQGWGDLDKHLVVPFFHIWIEQRNR